MNKSGLSVVTQLGLLLGSHDTDSLDVVFVSDVVSVSSQSNHTSLNAYSLDLGSIEGL